MLFTAYGIVHDHVHFITSETCVLHVRQDPCVSRNACFTNVKYIKEKKTLNISLIHLILTD